MAPFLMFSLTNPVAGREDEFNDWYSNVHVHDLVRIPGVLSARRYRMVIGEQWQYVTMYEVEAVDPRTVWDAIYTAAVDGSIYMSDSWDKVHYVGIAEAIGDPVMSSATS